MHEADDEPAPVINMARRDARVHNVSIFLIQIQLNL